MAYTVGFGKHKDRTLEWLFFNDPGYVWWMIEEGADAPRYPRKAPCLSFICSPAHGRSRRRFIYDARTLCAELVAKCQLPEHLVGLRNSPEKRPSLRESSLKSQPCVSARDSSCHADISGLIFPPRSVHC